MYEQTYCPNSQVLNWKAGISPSCNRRYPHHQQQTSASTWATPTIGQLCTSNTSKLETFHPIPTREGWPKQHETRWWVTSCLSVDMDNPYLNVLQRSKHNTYLEKYVKEYMATIQVHEPWLPEYSELATSGQPLRRTVKSSSRNAYHVRNMAISFTRNKNNCPPYYPRGHSKNEEWTSWDHSPQGKDKWNSSLLALTISQNG